MPTVGEFGGGRRYLRMVVVMVVVAVCILGNQAVYVSLESFYFCTCYILVVSLIM
jgi:hypothetical protein